jgi:hypothetical protein
MVLDQPMEFTQSDMPSMRLKLACLVYVHCNTSPELTGHTIHVSNDAGPNPPYIAHPNEISQDQNITTSIPDQSHAQSKNTGYSKLLNTYNSNKCKFTFSNASPKRKKSRIKSSSQSECLTSASDTHAMQQLRITDLLLTTCETCRKQKMSITDKEHPFKHKRFKKKDEKDK